MQSLITTFLHRPYVFAFLAAFLVIGVLNRGLPRTLLFLFLGFTIAWLSEFSSIRNGFPYGLYHYIYENMPGELILGGVPVWDSLSYSFVAYASYEMAAWLGDVGRRLSAAVFMVLLDVVVDPLAVRGDKWFLGKIFYYPEGGIYFGVPLSNFAGWFLVALAIFSAYGWLENGLVKTPPPKRAPFLGPSFYCGILFFNLAITFWIGEYTLGAVGIALHLLSGVLFFLQSRRATLISQN